MSIVDANAGVRAFHFNKKRTVLWIFGAFIALCIAILLLFYSRHQLDPVPFSVFWSSLWWFIVACTSYAVDTSEVLVSDQYVARRFWGRICHRVDWPDIERIRESTAQLKDGPITFINIVPRCKSFWRFQLTGTIQMSDRFTDFEELVSSLNKEIEKHTIRVEVRENGIWNARPRLLARVT